jgi:hypothetical protein
MKSLTVVVVLLLVPIAASAQGQWVSAGRLTILSTPAGWCPILESWSDATLPQGQNVDEWKTTPDLRATQSTWIPSTATAVLVQIKAKATVPMWADQGTVNLQVALRATNNTMPVSASSHARVQKPSGSGTGTYKPEEVSYNDAAVPVINGQFQYFSGKYIVGNGEMSLDLCIAGYYEP